MKPGTGWTATAKSTITRFCCLLACWIVNQKPTFGRQLENQKPRVSQSKPTIQTCLHCRAVNPHLRVGNRKPTTQKCAACPRCSQKHSDVNIAEHPSLRHKRKRRNATCAQESHRFVALACRGSKAAIHAASAWSAMSVW